MGSRTASLLLTCLLCGKAGFAQPVALPAQTVPGDGFGHGVAVSSPNIFVGAPGNTRHRQQSGALYVFSNANGQWREEAVLYPPDSLMKFGQAVAADGDFLAVSASRRTLDGSGVVLVYERKRTWRHVQTLSPGRPAVADHFGYSLALRGKRLVVGVPGGSGRAEADGFVRIFERGDSWRRVAELYSPVPSFQGRFGDAVAFDGHRVVVGAPIEKLGAGAAYVFQAGSWKLEARLNASHIEPEDEFGRSVAVHRNRVAVGAPRSAYSQRAKPGSVFVFSCRAACVQTHRLETPERAVGDQFGFAVSLSDSTVLVGAPYDAGLGDLTGAVHVFDASMHRTAILRASSMSERDLFGSGIAASHGIAVVAARTSSFTSGAAYVYSLNEVRTPGLSFRLVAHPRSGLSNRSVEALVQDAQGFLWIGTSVGLNRFDGSEYRIYRHDAADSTSISNSSILSLLEDRQGRLWVGTANGLNLYDPRSDRFRRWTLPSDSAYYRQSVRVLFEDREGRLWTGTNGRLYALRSGRFVDTGALRGIPERLDETYISGIQQDSAGRLWVLSKNLWELRASMYRYDPDTGDVVRYTVPETWGQIGPLLIDNGDGLWMKAPSPVPLPEGPEVHPAVPPLLESHWSFLEAQDGSVWVGTAVGLFRARGGKTESYQVMPNRVMANFIRSLYQARNGRIFVGTQDGLYVVEDPTMQPTETASVPLMLTEVRISGRTVVPSAVSVLRLSYRENQLALKYAVPVFGRTRPLRLMHRLSEVDHDFVEGPATYTGLLPGSYTFEVRALDDTLVAASLILPVKVLPPFWQTWWFRILILAGIAGALIVVHRVRVARVLELERLRTRIASDLHDDVSSNLSGIAFVTELVRRRPELGPSERLQLEQVAATARETIEDLRDIIWFIDPSRDELEALVVRMKEASSLILNGTEVDLRVEGDSDRLSMEWRRHIFLFYKEALHNVARHASARNVSVEITSKHRRFTMRIADDGAGFEPSSARTGHGIGSMRRRAEAMGGTLTIDSRPGSGTTLTLTAEIPRMGDSANRYGGLS